MVLAPMPGVLGRLRGLVSPVVEAGAKRRLAKAVNVADLRKCAEKRMHPMCFGYLDAGACDEVSLRRNHDAFLAYDLYHRVLSGVTPENLDTSTEIFGTKSGLPFFAAPTAGNRMFHHEGEAAVAAIAAETETPYCLSTLGTTSLSDISTTLPLTHPKVFQVYVWKDRGLLKSVLGAAKEAGFQTLALTVDLSWFGNRERDFRNDFTIPPKSTSLSQILGALARPAWTWDYLSTPAYTYALLDTHAPAASLAGFVNDQLAPDFTWRDAEWLCGEWAGHVAVKGVVDADDARRALEAGFSSLWLSNHGGRQLDRSPAPLDALPAVRDAVGDHVQIVIDGGVHRGTDVAVALALGANAVAIGKPYLFGLGAGGKLGVRKAFNILAAELRRAMGLLGAASVADLRLRGNHLVRKRQLFSPRDALQARYAPAEAP